MAWLGPDRSHPFDQNTATVSPKASRLVQLSEADADSLRLLWDYDHWWIEERVTGSAQTAPMGFNELFLTASGEVNAIRSSVRTSLAEDRTEAQAITSSLDRTLTRLKLLTAGLTVAGLIALILAARAVRLRVNASRHQVNIDPLTRIYNRRFIQSPLFRRGFESAPYRAVAMIDLDHFKLVNDSWGHSTGDEILRVTAQRLSEVSAQIVEDGRAASCWVIRMGGATSSWWR